MKEKAKSYNKKRSGARLHGTRVGSHRTGKTMEARFQAVFEGSRDAIGISKAGIHMFVNPAYLKLFGFPLGTDLAGKPVLDLIAPESRDQINAYTLRRIRGEAAPVTYETCGMRTDGSVFDMEVNVSLYRENGDDLSLVILRDITERKRAEEEIAERGAMLQQIMDTASVAIFLVDRSGRIVHANRRMAEMFSCSMEELVGSEYVDHVHPSERESGRQKMLSLLASKIPSVDLERLYWRKNSTQFWGHLAGRRFHDVHGNELGLIGVITDISVRKRAEEALRDRTNELESSNKELQAFTYSVSHDLRAPLRSVSGFSKIIYEDYADRLDEKGRDYLVRIKNGSDLMTQLIDDLLRLSRIARQDVERMDYDLSSLASAVISSLREAAPARRVDAIIADGLRDVVDPNLMKIALSNLFDNAWKFTTKIENARIEFGATKKDGKALYFVKDNGAGFDPAFVKKMFLPFQRLHSEQEFEGTGIGLAIVERIIHRHGGKVWAEGEVGKGATIFFTLGQKTSLNV